MEDFNLLDPAPARYYAWVASFPAAMDLLNLRSQLPMRHVSLLFILSTFLLQRPVLGQARSSDESAFRGNHAEIAITLRDRSGNIVAAPAIVKVYHSGALSGQSATSKGRAFFILNSLGDYTITVDATGYKSAQKDVSLNMPITDQEEIYLVPDSSPNETSGTPGKPLLAPRAKEALDKGLQSLGDNKLDEAQKLLDEAMKLAPSHPDVLYAEGVVYMKKRDWSKAQSVLEKATQIDPNHVQALAALGMALADDGKFEQAIDPLERSMKLAPGDWQTHWTLAKAYYHRQQFDSALKMSQQALEESRGAAPELELLVAQSLTAVGRYEDSAQALRDYLKNHPKEAGASNARRWLDRLAADGKIRRN
jgi:Tfp pilus assembly protein PilF